MLDFIESALAGAALSAPIWVVVFFLLGAPQ